MSAERLFWQHVDRGDAAECWTWIGGLMNGYGRFCYQGRRMPSHRWSYIFANGSLADDVMLDHACRNRACVNPGHLRPATYKENRENLGGAHSNNRCGVRGVRQARSGRWQVRVRHNRVEVSGGTFDTIQEASRAAAALRNSLFTYNDNDRAVA